MTDELRPEERSMRPASEDEESSERRDVPIRVHDKRVRHDDPETDEAHEEAADEEPSEEETAPDLSVELREAKILAEERLDQMKRLKADLENVRKRMIRDQTEAVDRASQRVVERLLPVLDDFERAIAAAKEAGGAEGLVKGVELVYRSLADVLGAEGLERLDAEGAAFDPHEHEAVSSSPGDVEDPVVAEVIRPGYRLKDRTIRPAMVHVTVPDEESPETEEEG